MLLLSATAIVRSFNHAIGHFPERREVVAKPRFRVMFRQVFHAQSTGNDDDVVGEIVARSFVLSFHRRLVFLSLSLARFLYVSLSLVTAANRLGKNPILSLSLSLSLCVCLCIPKKTRSQTKKRGRETHAERERIALSISISISLCARVNFFSFFPVVHLFFFS